MGRRKGSSSAGMGILIVLGLFLAALASVRPKICNALKYID
jgi:hypothetical protein